MSLENHNPNIFLLQYKQYLNHIPITEILIGGKEKYAAY